MYKKTWKERYETETLTPRQVKAMIADLERVRFAIELCASKFAEAQKEGNVRHCSQVQRSMIQAHGYLVREFGVETSAQVDALLYDLRNGNVRARLDSGTQHEKNTIWLSTAP